MQASVQSHVLVRRVLLNFTVNKFAPGTRPPAQPQPNSSFLFFLLLLLIITDLQICIPQKTRTRQEFDWLNIKICFSSGTWLATGVEPPRSEASILVWTEEEAAAAAGGRGAPFLPPRLLDLRASYGEEQEWRTAPWTPPSGLVWSRFQPSSGGKITRRFQYAGESEHHGAEPSVSGIKKKIKKKIKRRCRRWLMVGGWNEELVSSEAVFQPDESGEGVVLLIHREQWVKEPSQAEALALFNYCSSGRRRHDATIHSKIINKSNAPFIVWLFQFMLKTGQEKIVSLKQLL